MKRIAWILAALLLLSSCGPGAPPSSGSEPEPSVVETSAGESSGQEPSPVDEGLIADRMIRHLADEDYEAAYELCGGELTAALGSAEGVKAMWEELLATTGAYRGHQEPQSKEDIFFFPADFEQGRFMIQVAEQSGRVTGFFLWAGLGLAEQYADDFFAGNFEAVFAQSDANMQAYFGSADGVASTLEQLTLLTGNYPSRQSPLAEASGEDVTYRFLIQADAGAFDLIVTVHGDKVAGFGLLNSATENSNAAALRDGPEPSEDLPAGVAEEDIILGKGGPFPLHGKITYPEGAEGPLPVVVLVHGSGAHDMDETISANKPFKDIAYALSAQGIAVLRYHKAAYAYPDAFMDLSAVTIEEETTGDAVAALQALKEQSKLTFSKFYVAGHSLGGLMAPRIASEGGYDGMIILAGSPRSLVDISYDQAHYLMPLEESMTAEQKEAALAQYEALYQEAKTLMELPLEELAGKSIMGLPASYIYSMEHPDRTALLVESGIPALILQGGKDFQVYADKDYAAYKTLTAGLDHVECILYPELNHLFMPSTMEHPTTREYETPSQVDPRVTDDIVRWVLEESKS